MPTLEDPVPSDWQVVDDEFILFWASHVTHASVGFFHSPHSWVGDGTFQIMIVRRPMSRFQMVRILLSIDAGSHVDLNGVEFVRCTAFRLEPTGSYNVIDGEQVEPGTVQAHVIPKSMRVFCHPRQQQS
jgi:sphingosine kinase